MSSTNMWVLHGARQYAEIDLLYDIIFEIISGEKLNRISNTSTTRIDYTIFTVNEELYNSIQKFYTKTNVKHTTGTISYQKWSLKIRATVEWKEKMENNARSTKSDHLD